MDSLPDGGTHLREPLVYQGIRSKKSAVKLAIDSVRKWSCDITVVDEERHLIEWVKNLLT